MSGQRPILLVTLGSIGDLLPFLAVGRELRSRGREVIVATHDEYASVCRMFGFEFYSIWDGRRSRDAFHQLATSTPAEIWSRVRDGFFVPAIDPTFLAVERLMRTRNAIVVAAWSAGGAAVACEAAGEPFHEIYLSPYAHSVEMTDQTLLAALNRLRRRQGLRMSEPPRPRKRFGFYPRWFQPPERAWPEDVRAVGFPFLDDMLVPVSLATLRTFLSGGRKPFVFTPGSFLDQAGGFFSAALDACAATDRRAIFLTPHHDQIPAKLPPSILHLDYVPLHRLLHACAGLFHHGGIGTCAQALRAGTPQIIAPIFFDQCENAERVVQAGAGLMYDRDAYSAQILADLMDETAEIDGSNLAAIRSCIEPRAEADFCDMIEGSHHK